MGPPRSKSVATRSPETIRAAGGDPVKLFLKYSPMMIRGGLRRLVDQADGDADHEPLDEIGDGLVEREREADVQIDVVVNDEGTDRENADEGAEICAGGEATAGRINFGVEHGDDHDADEDGDHAVGHD